MTHRKRDIWNAPRFSSAVEEEKLVKKNETELPGSQKENGRRGIAEGQVHTEASRRSTSWSSLIDNISATERPGSMRTDLPTGFAR